MSVCAGGQAAAEFILAMTGCALTPNARTIQALLPSGEIVGVVAFDNWTATSAMGHVALAKPIAARPLLDAAFHYFFEEAGRLVMVGMVNAANTKAMRLDKHLGFREVGRIRDGAGKGADMVMMELRKEDCRYLRRQHARRAA